MHDNQLLLFYFLCLCNTYSALFEERLYLLVGYVAKYICRGVSNTVLLHIKFILWIDTM